MALLVATVCCIGCDLTFGAQRLICLTTGRRKWSFVCRRSHGRRLAFARSASESSHCEPDQHNSHQHGCADRRVQFREMQMATWDELPLLQPSPEAAVGALNEIIRDAGYRPAILAANLFAEHLVR